MELNKGGEKQAENGVATEKATISDSSAVDVGGLIESVDLSQDVPWVLQDRYVTQEGIVVFPGIEASLVGKTQE